MKTRTRDLVISNNGGKNEKSQPLPLQQRRQLLKRKHHHHHQLAEIYYNPEHPLGFTGNVQQLAKDFPTAREWLMTQPTYTLHRAVKRKFPTRKYRSGVIDRQWQADLVDMQSLRHYNDGYGYILTCIDIFSRYAWAQPLTDKSFKNVISAFEKIFITNHRKPQLLQTDQGREFENQYIQEYFLKQNIRQFSVKSPFKAAIVERFHRTLRSRMYRFFTANNTQKWCNILQKLVTAYNRNNHSALFGCAPISINNSNFIEIWNMRQNKQQKIHAKSTSLQLKVGDFVRLALVKPTFNRGYTPNWTREIFLINEVDQSNYPITYRVRDLDNNDIEGRFYKQEVQKVAYSNS